LGGMDEGIMHETIIPTQISSRFKDHPEKTIKDDAKRQKKMEREVARGSKDRGGKKDDHWKGILFGSLLKTADWG